MKKGKIVFTGNFFEYFFKSLFLAILAIVTLGIMLPYFFYWNAKYFFSRMEIH